MNLEYIEIAFSELGAQTSEEPVQWLGIHMLRKTFSSPCSVVCFIVSSQLFPECYLYQKMYSEAQCQNTFLPHGERSPPWRDVRLNELFPVGRKVRMPGTGCRLFQITEDSVTLSIEICFRDL